MVGITQPQPQHFEQFPCFVLKYQRALQVMISHMTDLHFDSSTSYSSQTTVLSAVFSSRPQLWIRTTHGKLNLQSRRGPKCWYLEGKVTGFFSEKKNITWKIIVISVHEIWVGWACTLVTRAEGAWKLNGSSQWSFSAFPVLHSSTCQQLPLWIAEVIWV